MKVLFTGRGRSGSWTIRGEQVGAALGATVKPDATLEDCRAADVIVAVKRIPAQLLANIHASGKPWVYDIVDAFPQPQSSTWSRAHCLDWLNETIRALRPTAVIWPTARMQDDFGGGWKVIYHHHRPGLAINPIRESIQVIGYEGSEKFLEGWMPAIEAECQRLGARFEVNPARLADVDIVLALRGPRWSGYATENWKSNVKLANAHASGTPFIGMPEAGYEETRTGAEYWVKTPEQLSQALKWLEAQSAREEVASRFLAAALPVERVAKEYQAMLCALKS